MAFLEPTLKGTYLTLLIGTGVPVPAPKIILDALQSVQVTNSKERSGFQLSFAMGKNSAISLGMLPAGYFDPIITRVIIIVTLNGMPAVLMDGLVTNQELSPSNEAGQSTLAITGEDLSLAMDLVERVACYPAMTEAAILYTILAPYAALGIAPMVIPPFIRTVRSLTEPYPMQRSTDRAFIKSMASRCGYVFFVHPGPLPGQSVAYFGPDVNLPVPQPAVSINLDAHSNAESLSFSLDGMAKKIRLFTIYDPVNRKIPIPIPLPNVDIFKPPLGLRPTLPARFEFADDAAHQKPDDAAQSILGFLMNNSSAISGNGTLNVSRYNHILRARMLVGVRGAGLAYDGLYYVDSVTHNIKKGEYKQSFSISRDGLISNTSNVPVYE